MNTKNKNRTSWKEVIKSIVVITEQHKSEKAHNQSEKIQKYIEWRDNYNLHIERLILALGLPEINRDNPNTANNAIAFIGYQTKAFRIGYFKERLIRSLKRFPFNEVQKQELREIFIKHISNNIYYRELKELTRLMIQISDKDLIAEINNIAIQSDNPYIKNRAARSVKIILGNRKDLRNCNTEA